MDTKNIVNTTFICANCQRPIIDIGRAEHENALIRSGAVLGTIVDINYVIPVCPCSEPKPNPSLPPEEAEV
jgi:hypothetical protein